MEKFEGPATILVFLGFKVNTEAMEVRLPQLKLEELKALTHEWLQWVEGDTLLLDPAGPQLHPL